jgi:predicted metal-dependent hydrolase
VSAYITYGQETIHYEVVYLPNRKTLGIEVHPDRRVVVRAPADCSPLVIVDRLQKRARWISRQLSEFDRYRPRTPPRQYLSGETHLYLGRQYRLRITRSDVAMVKLSRGEILIGMPGTASQLKIRAFLQHWYLERARSVYADVLEQCGQHFKKYELARISVREMNTRWGSLSRKGTMTLNSNLIQAPRPCIEYVVIHELCHLVHRDHDARFFKLLTQILPDWEKRKRRLELTLL